jgi:hypothetical protein
LPAAAALLAWMMIVPAGCNWLRGIMVLTSPEPTQHVEAEFDGLAGKRVVIVVEAEMETLFDFPRIQREAAEQIAYYLTQHVPKVKPIPPREVADYRERGYRTEYQPSHEIGEHFQADYVLRAELLTFATREEASGSLYRGRADVALALYDVRAATPTDAVWSGRVKVSYPPSGPLGLGQITEEQVYSRTLHLLGERVAQKFFDHDEAI